MNTYVTSCQSQGSSGSDKKDGSKGKDKWWKEKKDEGSDGEGKDTYNSASTKCLNQRSDCLAVNKKVSVSSGRCGSYNAGWN